MMIIQTAARKQKQRLAEEEKKKKRKKSEQMIREGKPKGGNKLSRLIHNHKETEKHENGKNRSVFEKEV